MLQVRVDPRIRVSPFFDATVAAGLQKVSTYNHMFMPTSYGDPDAEYDRLLNGVSIWDVACQRQVELRGPDAGRLAQVLTTRDLSSAVVGQGKYAPMTDHAGRIINDPLVLRVRDDTWWISIADGDALYWCRAIGAERGFDAEVSEPDVAPLAVQGPRAEDTLAALLGDWVRDIRFFWYHETEYDGIPFHIGRAGWSKQGGFELYLTDGSRGTDLWNAVVEAGRPFGIGPGAPNYTERIEAGLFAYRTDADLDATPFEVGLGKWVDLDADANPFIGREALVAARDQPLRRELVGIFVDGERVTPPTRPHAASVNGAVMGTVRVLTHSPMMQRNIGMAFMQAPANRPGTVISFEAEDGTRSAEVVSLPFDVG